MTRTDSPADGRAPCEGGSISAFVALLAVALMALAGLAIDGGRVMEARQAANAEAEQAARAGAAALSISGLREGGLALNVPAAITAAEAFTDASGHPGSAAVVGSTVVVTVDYRLPTDVLGIVGIGSLVVSGRGAATDLMGVATGGAS